MDTARNEMIKRLQLLEQKEPVGLTATPSLEECNDIQMTYGGGQFQVMYHEHAFGFRMGYISGLNQAKLWMKSDS